MRAQANWSGCLGRKSASVVAVVCWRRRECEDREADFALVACHEALDDSARVLRTHKKCETRETRDYDGRNDRKVSSTSANLEERLLRRGSVVDGELLAAVELVQVSVDVAVRMCVSE